MHHIREGKHGARSTKQAIAIGLSKARRAGVPLRPPGRGKAKEKTRRAAAQAYKAGQRHSGRAPSRTRSRATGRALRREPHDTASHRALAAQAHTVAKRRGVAARSASARRAVRTKGPALRKAAARKAAATRKHAHKTHRPAGTPSTKPSHLTGLVAGHRRPSPTETAR
jgi:hypothetical protein